MGINTVSQAEKRRTSGKMSSDSESSEQQETDSPSKSPRFCRTSDRLYVEVTDEEIAYREKHFADVDILNKKLTCTSCNKDLKSFVVDGRDIFCHPVLKVLLCKECCLFYGDGSLSMDEDGSDKYCRWCGQGGMLFCCAACSCAFCRHCLKRNLNRSVLTEVEAEDWKCFVCHSKPLWNLRAICWSATEYSNTQKRKRKAPNQRNLVGLRNQRLSGVTSRSLRMQQRSSRARYCSSSSDSSAKKKSNRRKRDESSVSSDSEVLAKMKNKKNDAPLKCASDSSLKPGLKSSRNAVKQKNVDSSYSDSDSKNKKNTALNEKDNVLDGDTKENVSHKRTDELEEEVSDHMITSTPKKKEVEKKASELSSKLDWKDNVLDGDMRENVPHKRTNELEEEVSDNMITSTPKKKDVEKNVSELSSKLDRKSAKKTCLWLQDQCKDISKIAEVTSVQANRLLAKKINLTNMTHTKNITKLVESMKRLITLSRSNLKLANDNLTVMHERWLMKQKSKQGCGVDEEMDISFTAKSENSDDERCIVTEGVSDDNSSSNKEEGSEKKATNNKKKVRNVNRDDSEGSHLSTNSDEESVLDLKEVTNAGEDDTITCKMPGDIDEPFKEMEKGIVTADKSAALAKQGDHTDILDDKMGEGSVDDGTKQVSTSAAMVIDSTPISRDETRFDTTEKTGHVGMEDSAADSSGEAKKSDDTFKSDEVDAIDSRKPEEKPEKVDDSAVDSSTVDSGNAMEEDGIIDNSTKDANICNSDSELEEATRENVKLEYIREKAGSGVHYKNTDNVGKSNDSRKNTGNAEEEIIYEIGQHDIPEEVSIVNSNLSEAEECCTKFDNDELEESSIVDRMCGNVDELEETRIVDSKTSDDVCELEESSIVDRLCDNVDELEETRIADSKTSGDTCELEESCNVNLKQSGKADDMENVNSKLKDVIHKLKEAYNVNLETSGEINEVEDTSITNSTKTNNIDGTDEDDDIVNSKTSGNTNNLEVADFLCCKNTGMVEDDHKIPMKKPGKEANQHDKKHFNEETKPHTKEENVSANIDCSLSDTETVIFKKDSIKLENDVHQDCDKSNDDALNSSVSDIFSDTTISECNIVASGDAEKCISKSDDKDSVIIKSSKDTDTKKRDGEQPVLCPIANTEVKDISINSEVIVNGLHDNENEQKRCASPRYTTDAEQAMKDLLCYSSDDDNERSRKRKRSRTHRSTAWTGSLEEKEDSDVRGSSEKKKKNNWNGCVRKDDSDSSCTVSSLTDTDCSTSKRRQSQKSAPKAKKLNQLDPEYIELDKKLRAQCGVVVQRLAPDHFSRYCSPESGHSNENKTEKDDIKSLMNLKNLKRNSKKKMTARSGSQSDTSDSKMKSSSRLKSKSTSKKDKEEQTLMDFHNLSDSDGIALSDIEDDDEGGELSFKKIQEELERKKNKLAKNMLLHNSSSDSDTKSKEEEEKPKRKEKKPKEEKVEVKEEIKVEVKEEKSEKGSNVEDKEEEEEEGKKKKNNWRKNRLLCSKLEDTSSSEEERRWKAKKQREEEQKNENSDSGGCNSSELKIRKKSARRRILGSDSDEVFIADSSNSSSDDVVELPKKKRKASTSSDGDKNSSSDSETKRKPKRRRIKRLASNSESNSGSEEDPNSSQKTDTPGKGRKNIRRVMKDERVGEATRKAAKEEEERRQRIADKQKIYNELYDELQAGVEKVDKLVLDFDPDTKNELVQVDKKIVPKLKPHQVKGVKFMWDACFESVKQVQKTKGSGCILAHCMGLGKTFQVVTLVDTLMNHQETKVKTVLVVCPLSTVLNWVTEFKMWLKESDHEKEIEIFELSKYRQIYERMYQLQDWQRSGGVLVIGYEMFRNLTSETAKRVRKKARDVFQETLVDPGPDLVVCDEGHLLKNEDTALSKAMRRIRTLRRIVLTGTPLQNNLKEYHCMVQFVKPNLLGTRKEFLNRFVNPISNGQFEDSTSHDVKIMKRRAHVLHKMLEGCVQRFDYSVLMPFLPPKHEYVIFIRLSELQTKMYQHYLRFCARGNDGSVQKGAKLFTDFQNLQRVWTHPRVLLMYAEKNEKKNEKERSESDSEGSLRDFIDDDDGESSKSSSEESGSDSDSDIVHMDSNGEEIPKKKKAREVINKWQSSTRSTKKLDENQEVEEVIPDGEQKSTAPQEWWSSFVKEEEMNQLKQSGKLILLFSILEECEKIGDKVLVFSQSLYSLDLIEYFLSSIDTAMQSGEPNEDLGNHKGSWSYGLDYFRLDGSTSGENRHLACKAFNREDNLRARLFLISTRAGGLGINLYAANRVIIFDASWNPSHDVQSIFRVYRFGQKKPCYIYRFLALGTMEEKIYDRQVTKLSLACRVVDEQQIERHFNMADLGELYSFDPEQKTKRPIPILPKDRLLAEMLKEHGQWIETYHEHDSLLENKQEEELNEEERKAAWEDYENEKKGPVVQVQGGFSNMFHAMNQVNPQLIREILKKENPTLSDDQLQQQYKVVLQQLYEYMNSTAYQQQQQQQYQQQYQQQQQQAMHQQRLQQQYQQQLLQKKESAMAQYTYSALAGGGKGHEVPTLMQPNYSMKPMQASHSSAIQPRYNPGIAGNPSMINPFAQRVQQAHSGRLTTVPTMIKDKHMESLLQKGNKQVSITKKVPDTQQKPTIVDTIDVE